MLFDTSNELPMIHLESNLCMNKNRCHEHGAKRGLTFNEGAEILSHSTNVLCQALSLTLVKLW